MLLVLHGLLCLAFLTHPHIYSVNRCVLPSNGTELMVGQNNLASVEVS
jgi:hypothetical protein